MAKAERTSPKRPRRTTGCGPLVGVIVDLSLPYDREIARGVAQYAREVGDWRLYIEEEEARRVPDFRSWGGNGLVASFDDERVARAVEGAGVPVVAVGGGAGYHAAASGIPYVETDNEQIAALAAEHLLDRGLPFCGFYGLPPSPTTVWSQARSRGFLARMGAAGKPCQEFVAWHEATQWQTLQKELIQWLTSLPRPVGIMACDDIRARHILEACRAAGLRVPHDVAVIGVDDDDLLCDFSEPTLSSVRQAARRIGLEAARLLDQLMQRPGNTPRSTTRKPKARRIVVPPIGVVARRSTQTVAVADPVIASVVRFVRERACGRLGIRDVVRESGLSRWVLEDRFRQAVGHSIHDDIVRVRLAEAQRLLTTTDLPVKAIAKRAGAGSVSYMTTLFRRHLDTTPAALRRDAGGGRSPSH
jgi:LacI family transcriptional regulator